MDEVRIKAIERKDRGTTKARAMRGQDFVPAVVYGKDFNEVIKIEEKNLKYLKQHHMSENVIIKLEIEKDGKSEEVPTLLKDYQMHPVKETILHLDFVKVSMKEKVQVEVPIETQGDAKGIKEGGALEHVLWNVEVECLPMDIPEKIVLDVSELGINESIHVSDISIPGKKVDILNDPKDVILTIVPPAKVEAPEKELTEEDEEPEVIKEKSAEEEGGEEGEAEGKEEGQKQEKSESKESKENKEDKE